MGAQRVVAAQVLEQQALHELQPGKERRPHEARDRSHQRGMEQRAAHDAQVDWRGVPQDGREELALHHLGQLHLGELHLPDIIPSEWRGDRFE